MSQLWSFMFENMLGIFVTLFLRHRQLMVNLFSNTNLSLIRYNHTTPSWISSQFVENTNLIIAYISSIFHLDDLMRSKTVVVRAKPLYRASMHVHVNLRCFTSKTENGKSTEQPAIIIDPLDVLLITYARLSGCRCCEEWFKCH